MCHFTKSHDIISASQIILKRRMFLIEQVKEHSPFAGDMAAKKQLDARSSLLIILSRLKRALEITLMYSRQLEYTAETDVFAATCDQLGIMGLSYSELLI